MHLRRCSDSRIQIYGPADGGADINKLVNATLDEVDVQALVVHNRLSELLSQILERVSLRDFKHEMVKTVIAMIVGSTERAHKTVVE